LRRRLTAQAVLSANGRDIVQLLAANANIDVQVCSWISLGAVLSALFSMANCFDNSKWVFLSLFCTDRYFLSYY
jgi:hypothetical protein